VRDSFGRVTTYEHDPVGNLISVIYPDASVVTYTHNRNNQVLTITDPDGGVTTNVYDSYGRLARQYLPNGGHTEFSYNTLNQLTQQREIFNHRTTRQFSYGYTDNGLLHTETIQFFGIDNENTNRMFLYDANGRLFSSSDTLLGRTDYYYDSLGNLVRETRDGVTTTFTHNAMNQLLTRTSPDGHFVYTYDQRGNLISESRNGVPVRTFEYDSLGRMIKGTNELGETSEYIYNALGLRVANVQRILPGHMSGQGWDVNGYLTDEPNSPGSRHINVNRQALAGLPTTVWLEGFADADSANAIDRYLWQGELPENIPTGAYQRIFKDNFGLNRNSGVVRQEFVIDYVMGFNQDLMVVEEGGFSTVFVYGTPLQRLSQHTSKADSIVSGVAAVGGALDPGGNVAADIAVLPTYAVLYYRLDFRNSTSQMQLPNGQYIAWAGYDEWGATTSPTDHDMNMAGVDPVRFTSHNFDRVLGLFYAQRRFYDSALRRFTQTDPFWRPGTGGGNMIFGNNPTLMPNAGLLPDIHAIYQSTNLYAYVMNNPVNFIDPTGLFAMGHFKPFGKESVPNIMGIGGGSIQPDLFWSIHWICPKSLGGMFLGAPTINRPPIVAWRIGNNVNIRAHISITGSGADTHRHEALSGIIHHWGGYVDGLNVNVTIFHRDPEVTGISHPNQAWLNIEIVDGSGHSNLRRPPTWTALNPGHITLYTHFWEREGQDWSLREKTAIEFMWVAAHEFGHALGVDDAHGFGYNNNTEHGDYYSIFAGVMDPVTRLDIEMVLQASRMNAWQEWYGNPLVQIYGTPR